MLLRSSTLLCFRIPATTSSNYLDINVNSTASPSNRTINTIKPDFQLEDLTCEKTPFNNSILMKSTCLPLWQGDEFHKCTYKTDHLPHNDLIVNIPATNTLTDTTYRNLFCAVCNAETHVELWNFNLVCFQNASSAPTAFNFNYHNATVTEMLEIWHSNRTTTSYKCNIEAILPPSLESHIHRCNSSAHQPSNTVDYHFQIRNLNTSDYLLPRSNTCDQLAQTRLYHSLCRNCTIDSFEEVGIDFFYAKSNAIYTCEHERYFLKPDWRQVNATYIHVCGGPQPASSKTPPSKRTKWSYELIEYCIMRQAEILITIYLATLLYTKNVETLFNKIIFTKFLILFFVRAANEYHTVFSGQYVRSSRILYHYFILSFYCWNTISCYDFWFVICRLTSRFQRKSPKSHIKRFFVYVLICNVLIPMPIIGMSVFFHFHASTELYCKLRIGYDRHLFHKYLPYFLFLALPSIILYFVSLAFFCHTCYFIYSNSKSITSSTKTNYHLLLLKLSRHIVVGTLGVLNFTVVDTICRLTQDPFFLAVRKYIFKCFGLVMYFLFAFPWKTVSRWILRYKASLLHSAENSTAIVIQ